MLPPITRVAFGIRFGPLWQIGDSLGSIVDAILRGSGSPFGPLTFPLSLEAPTTHQLLNQQTGDNLTITERDIVLTMSKRETLEAVQQLAGQFEDYIVQSVREHVELRLISRYGTLLEFAKCADMLRASLMKQYLAEDSDARDIQLRYSRRLPTEEVYIRKNVNDYRNLIYTLTQDQEKAGIGFDYQLYFDPALDAGDWKQRPFQQFVESACSYVAGPFEKWFKRLLKEERVA
jgi:hypothetical protein